MKAKRVAPGGPFRWQPEHVHELQEAFGALIEDTRKLPKIVELEERIKSCKLLYPHVISTTLSFSAIKNKLDRIYNITPGGPFRWQPEHVHELQEAFGALIEDTRKLPKIVELEERIKSCKLLYPHVISTTLSFTAIKNKLDRIYDITLDKKTHPSKP